MLESTENVQDAMSSDQIKRPAGFWMRFWAYTVDLIIVWCVNGILLSPFKFFDDAGQMQIGIWTLATVIATVVLYLYFLIMTKIFSQTVGKMIFGLKVIRKDETSPSWNDILFREIIGRFIHRVFSILTLLYIVVAFEPLKQGVHDMLANTRVIHER